MYRQIDGVSMGSLLGPTLVNIFVGFHENHFSETVKPLMCHCYVDDTFCLFENIMEAKIYFSLLNGMHLALKYTIEIETNSTISFLDVLVTKTTSHYITSIYHKPTFTGLYIQWNAFCPNKCKENLISTLTP